MFQTTNQQHVYSKWSQTIWWEYGNRTSSLDQNYYNVVRHGILTIEHHDDDMMIIVVHSLSGLKTLGDCSDWDPATTLMSRSAMLKSKTSQLSSMRWFDDILPQWSCFMSVNEITIRSQNFLDLLKVSSFWFRPTLQIKKLDLCYCHPYRSSINICKSLMIAIFVLNCVFGD